MSHTKTNRFLEFLKILLPAVCLTYASSALSQTQSSEPVEVYVWGQQPTSTATEQTVRQKDFELRPTTTPSDILRIVPGLFIAQHQGGGKADQIFLRGFDADKASYPPRAPA